MKDGPSPGLGHPAVCGGLNLTYGLDRFGRVIDQKWQTGGPTPTALDEYRYGYDPAGNRTYRQNVLCGGLSETYTHDGLGRLTGMKRGQITFDQNGQVDILSPTFTQGWTLDQLGNWQGLDTDGDSQPDQTRIHDTANEICSIDGCSTGLGYDDPGKMTGDGTTGAVVALSAITLRAPSAGMEPTAGSPV